MEFKALFTKLNELKTKEVEAFLKGMDVDILENFFKVLKQEKLIFKEMHEQVIKKVVEAKYTIEVLENELMRVLNWPANSSIRGPTFVRTQDGAVSWTKPKTSSLSLRSSR